MSDDKKSPLANIESINLKEKPVVTTEKPVDLELERRIENAPERVETAVESGAAVTKESSPEAGGIIAATARSAKQKEREKKIENILEEGLEDYYLKMPESNKEEFRKKGEETAKTINIILESGKVKVMKIIELIKNWLRIIPGVNRFFIEQEAKIKADEVMNLKDTFYNHTDSN